jgi:D-alanine transaminase
MVVFINGKYIDKQDACISPDDRGFLFGDGLYEVVLVYNGKPFRLEEHVSRLKRGCEFTGISLENADEIHDICRSLIEKNNLIENIANIYIQVTRGVYKRAHRFPPEDVLPTVYIAAAEFSPNRVHQKYGIKIITVPDDRWDHCEIKTIDLLPNVLAHQKAFDQSGAEAVFVDDGILLEGTHSNFFAVLDGKVYTHPESNKLLSGVTRQAVIQICNKVNIEIVEKAIEYTKISEINEAFVSSTTLEITPVVNVDDSKIGDGRPGEITKLIQDEYQRIVNSV